MSISINANAVINDRWTNFKAIAITMKSLSIQYVDDGSIYTIFAFDGNTIAYTTDIWKELLPDSVINGGYSQAQNDADKYDFEINYKSSANKPLEQRLSDGRLRVTTEKPSLSTVTIYSHNWCDPTTWYTNSVRVTENVTNSGDNLKYTFSHSNIIDTYHGKITAEDYLLDSNGHSYRIAVTVDGYSKIEQDPHYGNGGDFVVNYNDGYLVFLSPQDPSSVVNVTYHYSTSSTFTIAPTVGKQLYFGVVEIQFSSDVIITDSVIFQPYGYVDVFAPQYLQSNGGPYPSGTKIPLGSPLIYKTMQDYLNDSKKSYPTYPALGGSGWRGIQQNCVIMEWEYEGEKNLRSDYGMEIRLSLQHDCAFGGNYGTVTFYCKTESL